MTNNRYSYETKLEAVRLLNSGMNGRKVCTKGLHWSADQGLTYRH